MNLGFDLDKVFVDYPPFIPDWFFDKLYKEKDNGILLYRIPGKFEQKLRQILHLPFLRPGIKKNIATLLQISQSPNNHLFLISSRFSFLKTRTEQLSKRHKFDKVFKGLYFNYNDEQPHIFKDRILKKLAIDRYIDDDLSLVTYLAKHNPQTTFFWLNNKENKQLTNNIYAVTQLNAIVE